MNVGEIMKDPKPSKKVKIWYKTLCYKIKLNFVEKNIKIKFYMWETSLRIKSWRWGLVEISEWF